MVKAKANGKPSKAQEERTLIRLRKERQGKQEWEALAKAKEAEDKAREAAAYAPRPPILEERDGVLVDARWCFEEKSEANGYIIESHRLLGEWRYDTAMGRRICQWCFSSGYPYEPPNPCPICNTKNWYERPACFNGGWLCGTCYPGLSPEALEKTKSSE